LACGSERVSVDEVEGPFTWGGLENVMRVRHLWLAGQPDEAALEAAREAGVSVVINLREPSELDWDEQRAAEALGMTYYSVPIPREGPLPGAAIARIEELIESHEGQSSLVHCSSGNRAAGWLAVHLVTEHDMSLDEALAVGRRAGITKEPIAAKVTAFVEATEP
jgi:protein tyrosine phosphatase (PTP) superfamily phosphohydrolase (DUF442 family)